MQIRRSVLHDSELNLARSVRAAKRWLPWSNEENTPSQCTGRIFEMYVRFANPNRRSGEPMKKEYDFSRGKRGAALSTRGKTAKIPGWVPDRMRGFA